MPLANLLKEMPKWHSKEEIKATSIAGVIWHLWDIFRPINHLLGKLIFKGCFIGAEFYGVYKGLGKALDYLPVFFNDCRRGENAGAAEEVGDTEA